MQLPTPARPLILLVSFIFLAASLAAQQPSAEVPLIAYSGEPRFGATAVARFGKEAFLLGQASPGQLGLVRLDQRGNVLWARAYDAPILYRITAMSDGGVAVAGPEYVGGVEAARVIRFNADGSPAWSRRIRAGDKIDIHGIVSARSDLYVCGNIDNVTSFVSRFDRDGNLLWSHSYDVSDYDDLLAIAVMDDGDLVATGSAHENVWLVRLRNDGTMLWQKTFSVPGVSTGRAVAVLRDGIAVAASIARADGDVELLKVGFGGELLWSTSFGGPYRETAVGVVPSGGGVTIAALSLSFPPGKPGMWFVTLDGSGRLAWERSLSPASDPMFAGISGRDSEVIAISASFDRSSVLSFGARPPSPQACGAVGETRQTAVVLRPEVSVPSVEANAVRFHIEAVPVSIARDIRIAAAPCQQASASTRPAAPLATAAVDAPMAAPPALPDLPRLLRTKKYDDLEAIFEAERSSLVRLSDGIWRLHALYEHLTEPEAAGTASAEGILQAVEAWRYARPKSATPRIALAREYLKLAWEARGRGYGETVTRTGGEGYEQSLARVRLELDGLKGLSPGDAEYFVTLISFEGSSGGAVQEALRAGAEKVPRYLLLYRTRALFLLPQWGGTPAEYRAFAEQAARLSGGDAIYAQLALDILKAWPDLYSLYGFSWERVQRGYKELLDGPGGSVFMQEFAWMACQVRSRAVARSLFSRPELNVAPLQDTWESRLRFNACRSWAQAAGAEPWVDGTSETDPPYPLREITDEDVADVVQGSSRPGMEHHLDALKWVDPPSAGWPSLVFRSHLEGMTESHFTSFLIERMGKRSVVGALSSSGLDAGSVEGWVATDPGTGVSFPIGSARVINGVMVADSPPAETAIYRLETAEPVKPGNKVYLVGCAPSGTSCAQTVVVGKVIGRNIARSADAGMVQVIPGHRLEISDFVGGPMLNEDGQAVGVIAGGGAGYEVMAVELGVLRDQPGKP